MTSTDARTRALTDTDVAQCIKIVGQYSSYLRRLRILITEEAGQEAMENSMCPSCSEARMYHSTQVETRRHAQSYDGIDAAGQALGPQILKARVRRATRVSDLLVSEIDCRAQETPVLMVDQRMREHIRRALQEPGRPEDQRTRHADGHAAELGETIWRRERAQR